MQRRIFSMPIMVFGGEDQVSAISTIPDSIRRRRIIQGSLLRRVERISKAVLKLQDRSVELFLYHDSRPRAAVWMGCILLVSDALAYPLYDEELAGIIAHELSHAYFMDEFTAAKKIGDERTMRIVELKCDAVAMLTLKLMSHNAGHFLSGLRRLTRIAESNGYSLKSEDHPSFEERAIFAERFIKLLV